MFDELAEFSEDEEDKPEVFSHLCIWSSSHWCMWWNSFWIPMAASHLSTHRSHHNCGISLEGQLQWQLLASSKPSAWPKWHLPVTARNSMRCGLIKTLFFWASTDLFGYFYFYTDWMLHCMRHVAQFDFPCFSKNGWGLDAGRVSEPVRHGETACWEKLKPISEIGGPCGNVDLLAPNKILDTE